MTMRPASRIVNLAVVESTSADRTCRLRAIDTTAILVSPPLVVVETSPMALKEMWSDTPSWVKAIEICHPAAKVGECKIRRTLTVVGLAETLSFFMRDQDLGRMSDLRKAPKRYR